MQCLSTDQHIKLPTLPPGGEGLVLPPVILKKESAAVLLLKLKYKLV